MQLAKPLGCRSCFQFTLLRDFSFLLIIQEMQIDMKLSDWFNLVFTHISAHLCQWEKPKIKILPTNESEHALSYPSKPTTDYFLFNQKYEGTNIQQSTYMPHETCPFHCQLENTQKPYLAIFCTSEFLYLNYKYLINYFSNLFQSVK